MDKIIWNDDMDKVYGIKEYFENEKDFENKVNEEYTRLSGNDCLVSDVETKSCVCTGEGLEAETIIPLDETDINIAIFYIANVEKVEI